MTDLRYKLELLINGEIELKTLSKEIDTALEESPQLAVNILAELDEVFEQQKLDNASYALLRRHINNFRRNNPEITENSTENNSTVFEKTHNFNDEIIESSSAPDKTSISIDTDLDLDLSDSSSAPTKISDTLGSMPKTTVHLQNLSGDETANIDITGDYTEDSIIKHRFHLKKILGVGGMGKVYKALDLLKAEAKDKKPYVAVKLLNEDFKDHPESFIALQRESSRQQKLAHPNVATIYDFDRVGGPGTPVFITMELMEGMELKDYIKKEVKPKGGLPFKTAYEIIGQLASGLTYAHERQLVHSDFKPGNAFYCNDGVVKILDFGISRAVKNPITGETEKTLFDPGKLGALTPAYASLEMLEGAEPDTRDDIYALGCTAYELLTGYHPFNKLPADKALKKKLYPQYIKKLNKKQNRAMRRAVAFHRRDRSPNVNYFLEELEGKASWYKNSFFIAFSIFLIISVILYSPTKNYLHNKKIENIITEIRKNDSEVIEQELNNLNSLVKSAKVKILNDAKEPIKNHLDNKIKVVIAYAENDYDFSKADKLLIKIRDFYPDSIFLQEKEKLLSSSKKHVIGNLTSEYISALSDINLIKGAEHILDDIRKLDPNNPLLEDHSKINSYRILALEKFEENELDASIELLELGISNSLEVDQSIIDLKNKIEKTKFTYELKNALNEAKEDMADITSFMLYEKQIIDLYELNPNDDLLTELADKFKPIVENEFKLITQNGEYNKTEELANRLNNIMLAFKLNGLLIDINLANLTDSERKEKITNLSSYYIDSIDAAFENNQISNTKWTSDLLSNIQQLSSLNLISKNKSSVEKLKQYRSKIADLYISKAENTLKSNRFDIATAYAKNGELFAPNSEKLADILQNIENAKNKADRLARIEANKLPFKSLTEANNVIEAEKIYKQFQKDLPENDLYLTVEATSMLADAYYRLAINKAKDKDYEQAIIFADMGLKINPSDIGLNDLKNKYNLESMISELITSFKNDTFFKNDTKLKINKLSDNDPIRFIEFSNNASEVLAKRIEKLIPINENKAASLANNSASLFPASPVLAELKQRLKLKPWEGFFDANAEIKAGRLTNARNIQQSIAPEYESHPQFIKFSDTLEKRINELNEEYSDFIKEQEAVTNDYDELRLLKRILERIKRKWNDNPDIIAMQTELDEKIEKLKPAKNKILKREQGLDSIEMANIGNKIKKAWKPIVSNSTCTTKLAGYGTRAKAVCYDMLHSSARGPLMIVIPASENLNKIYAISKYEISVGDWSKYCILSNTCAPMDKDKINEPLTDISLQQFKDYAVWLSKRTGKTYRLPTLEEWKYAAYANGKQPRKDFNCRVIIGNKVIKGNGKINVKTGRTNGWGLKNYIGNVQELVVSENSILAVGGSYSDQLSKCDIELQREHAGNADNITGFRLVLDNI